MLDRILFSMEENPLLYFVILVSAISIVIVVIEWKHKLSMMKKQNGDSVARKQASIERLHQERLHERDAKIAALKAHNESNPNTAA